MPSSAIVRVIAIFLLLLGSISSPLCAAEATAKELEQIDLLTEAIESGCEEIVFAQRVSGRDHWYGNFGHYCETESPYTNNALIKTADNRYAFGEGG